MYSESVFIMLTREEGKPILGESITQSAEFRMNDLDEEQCQEFIKKFPFSDNQKEKKQELLITAMNENDDCAYQCGYDLQSL